MRFLLASLVMLTLTGCQSDDMAGALAVIAAGMQQSQQPSTPYYGMQRTTYPSSGGPYYSRTNVPYPPRSPTYGGGYGSGTEQYVGGTPLHPPYSGQPYNPGVGVTPEEAGKQVVPVASGPCGGMFKPSGINTAPKGDPNAPETQC